jgi:hypothetical protein
VSRDFIRGYLGARTSINTSPHSQIDFDVEVAGSGTVDTPVAYRDLLLACGFAETINAATDVTYNLITPATMAGFDSVYVGFEEAGEIQAFGGCRGNASFNLSAGTIPMISFTYLGTYNKPSVATLTPDYSAYRSPLAVNTANMGTLTLDGYAFITSSLTINLNTNPTFVNSVNGQYVAIGERAVGGSITFESELLATKDIYALIESHAGVSTSVLDIVHGDTAGDIIEIDAPAVQLLNPQVSDANGVSLVTCDFVAVPVSGNDEFVFITK